MIGLVYLWCNERQKIMKISNLTIGQIFTTSNPDKKYVLQNIIEKDGVVTYRYMRKGTGTGFKTTNKNLKVTLVD